MPLYKNDQQKYFAGLAYIFLIYTGYYFYFVDGLFTTIPSLMYKHVLLVGIACFVYFIGTLHLGKLQQSWMLFLWHIVHISLLSTLITINLYKIKSGSLSYEMQHLSDNIKEILISPMLYFLMGLLNRLLVLEQNKG